MKITSFGLCVCTMRGGVCPDNAALGKSVGARRVWRGGEGEGEVVEQQTGALGNPRSSFSSSSPLLCIRRGFDKNFTLGNAVQQQNLKIWHIKDPNISWSIPHRGRVILSFLILTDEGYQIKSFLCIWITLQVFIHTYLAWFCLFVSPTMDPPPPWRFTHFYVGAMSVGSM